MDVAKTAKAANYETTSNRAEGISLSVALVTFNRPQCLERCLKSWRAQSVAPLEIVISDDSQESYAAENKRLADQYSCRYTAGPRRGLYANRNHAALSCTGTHILSADDDHTHPPEYVAKVLEQIDKDPQRIWIFAERSENLARNEKPSCPPELDRSGHGRAPSDPDHCSAIADGSTVYPQAVFSSGMRCDETYPFGFIWYLWGKELVKNGWRISFSPATHIYNHEDMEERRKSIAALKLQLEVMTYVQIVNALWVTPSLAGLLWSFAYLIRRILLPDSIVWFQVKTRLDLLTAARLLWHAATYPSRQKKVQVERKGQAA